MVVGFDADSNAINEHLYEDSAKLQIIPIIGMGGIGKTTLARRVYEDSLLAQYFDIYAWITVSAEYRKRHILSRLLHHLMETDDVQFHRSDAQLATLVHQNLVGRRYLFVIDDVWDTRAWDDLKMIFPDDGSGSRILMTTRLSDVAVLAGSSNIPLHQIKFLNESELEITPGKGFWTGILSFPVGGNWEEDCKKLWGTSTHDYCCYGVTLVYRQRKTRIMGKCFGKY